MQRWLEQQAENLQKEYDKANTPQPGGAEPTRSADPDAGAGPSSGVEAMPSFSRFSSLTSALTPTLDLSKQLGEITSVGKQIGDIKSVSKQLSNTGKSKENHVCLLSSVSNIVFGWSLALIIRFECILFFDEEGFPPFVFEDSDGI